ncbi:hypothetical protein [Aeromicrobium sp. CF3.5]|uniref:hypothetical protein n=1 Tax=Aeromicrobium sp. CF3.5 TaxID=3373078 RepID=UPI003EE66360
MSEHHDPVAFGPIKKVIVALAGFVLLGSIALQVGMGEFLWGSTLTAVGMVALIVGQYLGWRAEQRLERERFGQRE